MSTTPERFMNALDRYVDAAVAEQTKPDHFTRMARQQARQTLINELRLLLKDDNSAYPMSPTAKSRQWRK